MSEPKKYTLTTIAEIEQIPKDKLDEFFADLKNWLNLREAGKELAELMESLGPGNSLSQPDSITWVDDDKRSINLSMNIKISDEET